MYTMYCAIFHEIKSCRHGKYTARIPSDYYAPVSQYTYMHVFICTMRSMRSMRGGFIFRSRGPLQKVCHDPARMSGHDCLPGPQTVCFPGGRPHEQNEEVPQMDGSAGRTHTIRTAHTVSLLHHVPQVRSLSRSQSRSQTI